MDSKLRLNSGSSVSLSPASQRAAVVLPVIGGDSVTNARMALAKPRPLPEPSFPHLKNKGGSNPQSCLRIATQRQCEMIKYQRLNHVLCILVTKAF